MSTESLAKTKKRAETPAEPLEIEPVAIGEYGKFNSSTAFFAFLLPRCIGEGKPFSSVEALKECIKEFTSNVENSRQDLVRDQEKSPPKNLVKNTLEFVPAGEDIEIRRKNQYAAINRNTYVQSVDTDNLLRFVDECIAPAAAHSEAPAQLNLAEATVLAGIVAPNMEQEALRSICRDETINRLIIEGTIRTEAAQENAHIVYDPFFEKALFNVITNDLLETKSDVDAATLPEDVLYFTPNLMKAIQDSPNKEVFWKIVNRTYDEILNEGKKEEKRITTLDIDIDSGWQKRFTPLQAIVIATTLELPPNEKIAFFMAAQQHRELDLNSKLMDQIAKEPAITPQLWEKVEQQTQICAAKERIEKRKLDDTKARIDAMDGLSYRFSSMSDLIHRAKNGHSHAARLGRSNGELKKEKNLKADAFNDLNARMIANFSELKELITKGRKTVTAETIHETSGLNPEIGNKLLNSTLKKDNKTWGLVFSKGTKQAMVDYFMITNRRNDLVRVEEIFDVLIETHQKVIALTKRPLRGDG